MLVNRKKGWPVVTQMLPDRSPVCVDKLETEMAWVSLIYLHQSVSVPCVETPIARYTLSVEVKYDIVRLPIMPQGIACSRRHVGP